MAAAIATHRNAEGKLKSLDHFVHTIHILAKLGVLDRVSACGELTTKPWVQGAGFAVLEQSFVAKDNIATGGDSNTHVFH